MSKIKIITDSASDLTVEEAEALDVAIVPIHLFFGDREYRDGINLTKNSFYDLLKESELFPKTSQINPFEFEEVFEKYKDYEIIHISMSSKLSGSIQSARIASEGRSNVHIVDSLNACIGQRILVRYAAKLVNEGKTAEEIIEILERKKGDIRLVAVLDTLEYLKKGGRISATAATLGTVLSIKPLIAVEEGEVKVLGKVRGIKSGHAHLTEVVENDGGIDFEKPYDFAFSGKTDELLRAYLDAQPQVYEGRVDKSGLSICQIGSIIGTYAGPGAIGIAYFKGNAG